jgi:hypothetical protein
VAVIAIPLAFRHAAACAVEATNGPAVQNLTWISLTTGVLSFLDIQIGERRLVFSRATVDSDSPEDPDTSVCRLRAKTKSGNGDFDRSPPALHPPFLALSEGVRVAFYRYAFLRFFILFRVLALDDRLKYICRSESLGAICNFTPVKLFNWQSNLPNGTAWISCTPLSSPPNLGIGIAKFLTSNSIKWGRALFASESGGGVC